MNGSRNSKQGEKLSSTDPSRDRWIIGMLGGLVFCYLLCMGPELVEWFAGSPKAKTSQVFNNMKDCQIAAEKYADEHDGLYPKSATDDDFRARYAGRKAPINPFSNLPEWPVDGNVTNVDEARRKLDWQVGKGVVEYSSIGDSKGETRSYAVRGGDQTGAPISLRTGKPPFKAVVLSNR